MKRVFPTYFFQKRILFYAPQLESRGDTLETYLALSYCEYRLIYFACDLKKYYTLAITSIMVQMKNVHHRCLHLSFWFPGSGIVWGGYKPSGTMF